MQKTLEILLKEAEGLFKQAGCMFDGWCLIRDFDKNKCRYMYHFMPEYIPTKLKEGFIQARGDTMEEAIQNFIYLLEEELEK